MFSDKGELHTIDAGAVGIAVGTFFGWLPNIAALLSVIWLILRIYEMRTVQRWLYGEDMNDKNHTQQERNDAE